MSNIPTKSNPMLISATANGAVSVPQYNLPTQRTFNGVVKCTSGNASATVLIEACDVDDGWVTIGTLTLSGNSTTPGTDGFYYEAPWTQVRSRITAISGTGAAVSTSVGF